MTITTVPTDDAEKCLEIRRMVFVEEQGVPVELETDALDSDNAACDRFLIFCGERAVGTFRCFFETPDTVHLQRLCVLPEYRMRGCGRAALGFAEEFYAVRGAAEITLNAQCTAAGFYERCGYRAVSGVFYDAGIPHKRMKKAIICM